MFNKRSIFNKKVFLVLLFLALPCFVIFASNKPVLADAPQSPAANSELASFGFNLFQGNFIQAKAENIELGAGDQVLVRLWGGASFDGTVTVNENGEIELPAIGKMPAAGLQESQLNDALRSKLNSSGQENTQIYSRILNSQPVAIFVTGYVLKPGRYSGARADSVLSFLDRAGGIDPKRGSYRSVRVLRANKEIGNFDLYPFVLRGELTPLRLQNGDTIVVKERGVAVSVSGDSRNSARFELKDGEVFGETIVKLADPAPTASHVSITGTRNGAPYNLYLTVRDFRTMPLSDGDKVQFLADTPGDTIMVEVAGAIRGASRFPLRNGTRLKELQQYIAVDPARANLAGLYIKRKSVAVRQKKAIAESVRRLEQSSMTATSSSPDEAQIRSREAEMIAKLAEKALAVEPDGVVIVGRNGKISDIALENGDIVVIPERSDVVLVSGEVVMPQALVWTKNRPIEEYIKGAGGFTTRGDTSNLLLIRPNGEIIEADDDTILPGDQLLVLPRFESKNMQMVKDISQIIYQIAVATKMIVPF